MNKKTLNNAVKIATSDKNYKELNIVKVSVNRKYFILNFNKIENGQQLKKKIERKYYDRNFNLSNKILISEAVLSENKFFPEGRFKDLNYISGLKNYNPFTDQEIFTDLYYIDTENKESILNFVNKYGLLESDYRYKNNFYKDNFANPKTLFNGNYRIEPVVEDLPTLKKEIETFKEAVNFWRVLNNENIKSKKIIELYRKYTNLKLEFFKDNFHKIKDKKKKPLSKFLLQDIYDRALKNINPILRPSSDGYSEGFTSSTLFSVIYFQLYKMILNKSGSFTCDYCGKLNTYKANAKNDRFCNKGNYQGHSECNNKYNYMKNKALKKIINNKMNLKEIKKVAKNINWTDFYNNNRKGRELKEVFNWLKNYAPRSKKKKQIFDEYKNNNKKLFNKIENQV